MIYEYLKEINNKRIFEFNKGTVINPKNAYRIRTEWEGPEMSELLEAFFVQDSVTEIQELVIGWWGEEDDGFEKLPAKLIENLVAHKDRLPNLKHFVLGDIISEDNEMSWIRMGDIQPLLQAFPNLEYLMVRSGEGPTFGQINLEKLHTFIYETSGLTNEVLGSILEGNMPNLNQLKIWMGTDGYGLKVTPKDFEPLLNGTLFPNLKYLGLNNSEIINELAEALIETPILDRIEMLDLSGGILKDKGAQFLLNNPKIKNLKYLNLRHHYLSEEMEAKLGGLMGDRVNLNDNMSSEVYDDYYFTEVTE